MARSLGSTLNQVLRPLGLELRRVGAAAPVDGSQDPRLSYMDDPGLQDVLLDELAQSARTALADGPQIGSDAGAVAVWVRDFWRTYRARPFADSRGGGGFHNSFWVYLVARALDPALIVESGVWKGHTSWLLAQACPQAEIHGFDLDLSRLDHHDARVQYHQHDWARHAFASLEPERALSFFDCHVNHAQRIKEAHARGFRHLLVDDDPPLHKLYSYGLPGFPTVQMICAELPSADTVAWHWRGKRFERPVDREEMAEARRLIDHCFVFPDVGGPTRYGRFSFLTYVRLVPPDAA